MRRAILFILFCYVLLPLNGQQYDVSKDTVIQLESGDYQFVTIRYDQDQKGELTYKRIITEEDVMKMFYAEMRKKADLYAGIILKQRELEASFSNFKGLDEVLETVIGKTYTEINADSLLNNYNGVWLLSAGENQKFVYVDGLNITVLKTNQEGFLEPAGTKGHIEAMSPYWLKLYIENFAQDTIDLFGADVFYVDKTDEIFFKKTTREYGD